MLDLNIFPDKRSRTDGWIDKILKACYLIRKTVLPDCKVIFLSPFPKSGSTYLSKLLESATGFERTHWVPGYKRNEQDLYLPRVIDSIGRNAIIYQHAKANERNLGILKSVDASVIVHTRNIYDCMVSLRDYYEALGVADRMPFMPVVEHYGDLTEEQKLDLCVDMATPWYIHHYVSWSVADRNKEVRILWTSYESLVTCPKSFLERILEFCEMDVYVKQVEDALDEIDEKKSRFNKGIVGRGVDSLTDFQKEKMRNMTRYFPDIDFSTIGL